jgi:hypothetical protein
MLLQTPMKEHTSRSKKKKGLIDFWA